MTLQLTNNVSREGWTFSVTDTGVLWQWWQFPVVLPSGMPDGEYTYVLVETGQTGLLQIGKVTRTRDSEGAYTGNDGQEFRQYGI